MSAVVADTHALLWYLLEPGKLSPDAHTALKQADDAGEIYIPSVELVELRYLVEKGTISEPVFEFVVETIADPLSSLHILPLDFDCALAVGKIARATVPDMPDRMIAAIALESGFPLVTCDHKIIASGIPTIW